MCSGGRWPAGRDTRFPRQCVYPGVLALYNELDIGHMQRIKAGAQGSLSAVHVQVLTLYCSAKGLRHGRLGRAIQARPDPRKVFQVWGCMQASRKAAEERRRSHGKASTSKDDSLEHFLAHKAELRERIGPDPTNEAATDSDEESPGRSMPSALPPCVHQPAATWHHVFNKIRMACRPRPCKFVCKLMLPVPGSQLPFCRHACTEQGINMISIMHSAGRPRLVHHFWLHALQCFSSRPHHLACSPCG